MRIKSGKGRTEDKKRDTTGKGRKMRMNCEEKEHE